MSTDDYHFYSKQFNFKLDQFYCLAKIKLLFLHTLLVSIVLFFYFLFFTLLMFAYVLSLFHFQSNLLLEWYVLSVSYAFFTFSFSLSCPVSFSFSTFHAYPSFNFHQIIFLHSTVTRFSSPVCRIPGSVKFAA